MHAPHPRIFFLAPAFSGKRVIDGPDRRRWLLTGRKKKRGRGRALREIADPSRLIMAGSDEVAGAAVTPGWRGGRAITRPC